MPEVHFIGEIVGASGFDGIDLHARWNFVFNEEKWRLLQGDQAGRTWMAERGGEDGDIAAWNHPIDACFATTGLAGWPQLLLEVHQGDFHRRVDPCGHGFINIPSQPGEHTLECVISRPKGSQMEELRAYYLGGNPRYVHPDVVLKGDSRAGHCTVPTGVVWLKLTVVVRGFGDHVLLAPRNRAAVESQDTPCGGCKANHRKKRLPMYNKE